MSEHQDVSEFLAEYAAGTLSPARRHEVEAHLATCAECRADLALWQAVREEIVSADQSVQLPAGLAGRVLAQAGVRRRASLSAGFSWMIQLLRSQAQVIQREIWPASAIVMAIGLVFAMAAGRAGVIQVLAPLIAVASVALLFGSEQDPGFELAIATVTSPRQILLARLALVFGFDLLLTLGASLCLIPLHLLSLELLGAFILDWLSAMAFLSMAALLLSLWMGATNAIGLAYVAWLARYLADVLGNQPLPKSLVIPSLLSVLDAYSGLWSNPNILLFLSLPLAVLAFWLAGRAERFLPRWA